MKLFKFIKLAVLFLIFSIFIFSDSSEKSEIYLPKKNEAAKMRLEVTKVNSKEVKFVRSKDRKKLLGSVPAKEDDIIFLSKELDAFPSISSTNGRRKLNNLKIKKTSDDLVYKVHSTKESKIIEIEDIDEAYLYIIDKQNYELKDVYKISASEELNTVPSTLTLYKNGGIALKNFIGNGEGEIYIKNSLEVHVRKTGGDSIRITDSSVYSSYPPVRTLGNLISILGGITGDIKDVEIEHNNKIYPVKNLEVLSGSKLLKFTSNEIQTLRAKFSIVSDTIDLTNILNNKISLKIKDWNGRELKETFKIRYRLSLGLIEAIHEDEFTFEIYSTFNHAANEDKKSGTIEFNTGIDLWPLTQAKFSTITFLVRNGEVRKAAGNGGKDGIYERWSSATAVDYVKITGNYPTRVTMDSHPEHKLNSITGFKENKNWVRIVKGANLTNEIPAPPTSGRNMFIGNFIASSGRFDTSQRVDEFKPNYPEASHDILYFSTDSRINFFFSDSDTSLFDGVGFQLTNWDGKKIDQTYTIEYWTYNGSSQNEGLTKRVHQDVIRVVIPERAPSENVTLKVNSPQVLSVLGADTVSSISYYGNVNLFNNGSYSINGDVELNGGMDWIDIENGIKTNRENAIYKLVFYIDGKKIKELERTFTDGLTLPILIEDDDIKIILKNEKDSKNIIGLHSFKLEQFKKNKKLRVEYYKVVNSTETPYLTLNYDFEVGAFDAFKYYDNELSSIKLNEVYSKDLEVDINKDQIFEFGEVSLKKLDVRAAISANLASPGRNGSLGNSLLEDDSRISIFSPKKVYLRKKDNPNIKVEAELEMTSSNSTDVMLESSTNGESIYYIRSKNEKYNPDKNPGVFNEEAKVNIKIKITKEQQELLSYEGSEYDIVDSEGNDILKIGIDKLKNTHKSIAKFKINIKSRLVEPIFIKMKTPQKLLDLNLNPINWIDENSIQKGDFLWVNLTNYKKLPEGSRVNRLFDEKGDSIDLDINGRYAANIGESEVLIGFSEELVQFGIKKYSGKHGRKKLYAEIVNKLGQLIAIYTYEFEIDGLGLIIDPKGLDFGKVFLGNNIKIKEAKTNIKVISPDEDVYRVNMKINALEKNGDKYIIIYNQNNPDIFLEVDKLNVDRINNQNFILSGSLDYSSLTENEIGTYNGIVEVEVYIE